ncbi:unnamed protein product [Polarella glacialis]|uniref:V-type proton ATPase subunit E n=1 Tax=Polarella glacialis TaxID=89957 RepID=A0A813IHE5_POLGL|nr:unnamed protein product [Polarella glacialis]CAE8650288.1 unnamed protein product [Polarella glacialis]
MDTMEASKQIEQMRTFILAEAVDKAADITKKGEEEFSIEVHKLITDQKEKVRQAYERKTKQVETSYAIAKSMAINKQRLEKIKARQEVMNKVGDDAKGQLVKEMQKADSGKKFITGLIVQGLLMLLEKEVVVRCRKSDVAMVAGCLKDASDQYAKIIKDQSGASKACALTIDSSTFLPPAPVPGQHGQSCLGGVLLHCFNGKITIDNTLDVRLNLVMEQAKPAIRALLFPQKA